MKTRILTGIAAGLLIAPTMAQSEKAAPTTPKQEQKKAQKIQPVKAMRLVAGGQAGKAPDQAELKQRFEAKMAEAWIENANWETDYDKARAAAKESGKLIFAYFTRSYAP